MVKVGIINYNVGNLGSLINAFRRVDSEPIIINEPSELMSVDAVVLPGVGSFDAAMSRLGRFRDDLSKVRGSVPMLGICLGLQVMFEGSDEGSLSGLSWYLGRVSRLGGPRVPHIGWDLVRSVRPCEILDGNGYFYFMHSYAVINPGNDLPYSGITRYGDGNILSVLCDKRSMTFGVQFHQKKRQETGIGGTTPLYWVCP
ncbi:imidazole glycerol phosphate synthase subunit HisH [Vulcanisaeta souniana]|uniref:imidazole glycerol phosphate synthase subunit HisH n=1 Tax=Vulcanisaeta souniana TaxID=164452 RepID=UPI0006CF3B47|nr:imidazole glycerol phosphate synthase subunit HisH [Vulcanisaeta souniana]